MMIKRAFTTGKGQAHAKAILVGEHAVIYGQPAIALPLSNLVVNVYVQSSHSMMEIDSACYVGPMNLAPITMQGIPACVEKVQRDLGHWGDALIIRIVSAIPIGFGLGSSAAVSVALVRALYSYYHEPLDQDTLMRLVHVAEVYAHGKPSGIDAWTASVSSPIWFVAGERPVAVSSPTDLHLAIAVTGHPGDTKTAVMSVVRQWRRHPRETRERVTRLGELATMAREALSGGDLPRLGGVLTRSHAVLQTLGVSNHELDTLVNAALEFGAWGAKLTGAGRGGAMIALAHSQEHAQNLCTVLGEKGSPEAFCYSTRFEETQPDFKENG